MKFAIIDISSSSISLLAAEGEKTFDILFRERENVSILHYMEGKNLSERGVEKIAENLEKMKEICRKAGIDKCYVISTASMRNFENFEWVIEELYKRVAVRVNLLDGQEEAYCDLVSNERYRALDRAVLADIGGGSIELCDLTKDNPDSLVYLDFGPIQINHRFVANIHPTEGEAKDIKKYVRKKLEKSGLPGGGALSTAVLVGATNQAIYDVYCDYYDEERAAGEKRIEYDRLKKLCKHLVRSSDRSMLVLKNAPEKIYTLTTATVILRAMLKYFGVSNVVVSEFGVKEGYLSLVTDGRWKGVETDLDEVPEGVSVPAPVEEQPVAEKKAGKGRKAAKRRGRPKKAVAEEKPAEVAEEVKAEEKPVAKRRGRPKKAVAEEKPAEVAEEVKAEEKPVVKRRGRPKKAVAEEKPAEVAEEVKATEPEATETAPAEIVTEVKAEEKPAARPARRRRARTVKAAETEEEVKPARRTRRKAEKPADKDPAEAKPVRRTRRKAEKPADKELAEVKPVRRTRRKAAKPAAPEMPEIPEGATPEDIAEIIRTAAAEAGVPVEITFEESVSETAEAPASDAPAETVGTPEAAEAAEVTERAESVQAEPARAAEETAPAAEAGKEENGDQGV